MFSNQLQRSAECEPFTSYHQSVVLLMGSGWRPRLFWMVGGGGRVFVRDPIIPKRLPDGSRSSSWDDLGLWPSCWLLPPACTARRPPADSAALLSASLLDFIFTLDTSQHRVSLPVVRLTPANWTLSIVPPRGAPALHFCSAQVSRVSLSC